MSQSSTLSPALASAPAPRLRLPWRRVLHPLPGSVWILLDFSLAVLSMITAVAVFPDSSRFFAASSAHGVDPRWFLFSYAFSVLTIAHIVGAHEPHLRRDRLRLALLFLFVLGVTTMLLTTFYSVVFSYSISHRVLLLACSLTWLGAFLARMLYWHLTEEHVHRVGLVGDSPFREAASSEFGPDTTPIQLQALSTEDLNASPSPPETLRSRILDGSFDEIVTQPSLSDPLMSAAASCLDQGVPVFTYPQFIEHHLQRVPVDHLESEWFLGASLLGMAPCYRIAKRMIDLGIGTLGLLLCAPLIAVAVLAIRLTSRGPAFYSQTRVGLYNQPFRIYKLRSMRTDAEKSGAQWARKRDDRVTPVGRILRKTRIDELPQFWNILRGDMAFIGPRPERPEFTRELAEKIPFYEKRHLVKPGLTGWAQIHYPYGASVEDARCKLEYDLYYVKHGSLQLDLHILVRTAGAIMKGAR